VIPPSTLLIESPAAIVDSSVDRHANRPLAEAFLEFLLSDEGQRIFGEYGFRPVKSDGAESTGGRQVPQKVFTIADLGGWAKIEQELYSSDGLWTAVAAERSQARGR
jgi:sulfate transport system substrate-binding protein